MATKLTPRQQEIKALTEAGKTAPEIGEALGISTNAVYQQLRRMRGGKGGSKAKSGRKSAASRKPAAATPTPAAKPTPAPAPKPISPDRALANRRIEIERELRVKEKAVEEARASLVKLEEATAKNTVELRSELERIVTAEQALAGTLPVPKAAPAKPKSSSAAKKNAAPRPKAASKPKGSDAPPEAPAAPQAPAQAVETPAPAPTPTPAPEPTPAVSANGGDPTTQAEREAAAEHSGQPEPSPA